VEGFVQRLRLRSATFAVALALTILGAGFPRSVAAGDDAVALSAYLDGQPIPPADASKYHCDDFSDPVIVCSVSAAVSSSRALAAGLLSGVDYVSVYDLPLYSGSSMNISQDYTVLALIGWNDRISSFRARNGETGTFFVDWFYGGSQWSFCCNTQQPSLGGYDNTFSSVQRT
jgi:hypothetical protein